MTIGILEDDKDIRDTLFFVLEGRPNFEILFAEEKINEILLKVSNGSIPEILIVDHWLESYKNFKSGEDVAKFIVEQHPDVKIVMCTAVSDISRFRFKGCRGHIKKPFELNTLIEVLEKVWYGGLHFVSSGEKDYLPIDPRMC